ncbi:MAG: hypothetical protein N4A31_00505 [Rickettsiales bacterium]|jgi:hypothetical protein|nr:hypothetical protein [Rickettsiales bacterium]
MSKKEPIKLKLPTALYGDEVVLENQGEVDHDQVMRKRVDGWRKAGLVNNHSRTKPLEKMPPHRQENLEFLRDRVNNGNPLILPTLREDPFGDVEFRELAKRYEKIHGKGSLEKDLKAKFLERAKAKGSSFSERATESKSQESSGRGK